MIILEESKNLSKTDNLYIYVGSEGIKSVQNSTYINGGYNGGGSANYGGASGGGSTDIRLKRGNDFDFLKTRIMVAAGGGGSGYYGGAGGSARDFSGSGGSSFISGHNGCDAIKEELTEDNIIHTGQFIHYSGYKFNETIMVDGAGYNWTNSKGKYTEMSSHDGKSTMVGNSGNGYAKITLISKK